VVECVLLIIEIPMPKRMIPPGDPEDGDRDTEEREDRTTGEEEDGHEGEDHPREEEGEGGEREQEKGPESCEDPEEGPKCTARRRRLRRQVRRKRRTSSRSTRTKVPLPSRKASPDHPERNRRGLPFAPPGEVPGQSRGADGRGDKQERPVERAGEERVDGHRDSTGDGRLPGRDSWCVAVR
jgi:hypothetical protein